MSRALERLIAEVKRLSPDEQKVLREALDEEASAVERERRRAISRQVRGKYAHLGASSDEFAARKREEIEREDRQRSGL